MFPFNKLFPHHGPASVYGRWSFEIENVLVLCVNEKRKKERILPKANEEKYRNFVRKNTPCSR
jgi:hypothetical protein